MKKEERGLNQHSTGISLCISCPRIFCRKISSDCYNQWIRLDVVTFRLEFLQGCSLIAKRGTEDKLLDHLKTPTIYFQNLKPKAKQKGNSVLRGGQRYRVLMKGRLRGVILRVLTFHSHDNLPTKSNFGLTFLAFLVWLRGMFTTLQVFFEFGWHPNGHYCQQSKSGKAGRRLRRTMKAES